MNARYYSRLLRWLKNGNLTADIIVALSASVAFVGLLKDNGWGVWLIVLVAIAAVTSALRPILRISDKMDRYAKLHYDYLELFYRIESLVSEMRSSGHIDEGHFERIEELEDRFRSLELEGDAYQNQKKLSKDQDEIDQIIPPDRLWLPSQ